MREREKEKEIARKKKYGNVSNVTSLITTLATQGSHIR